MDSSFLLPYYITELYWEAMSSLLPADTDDQVRLNWALADMQIHWENPHSDMTDSPMTGEGRDGFKVTILPTKDVCRQTCEEKSKVKLIICKCTYNYMHTPCRIIVIIVPSFHRCCAFCSQ